MKLSLTRSYKLPVMTSFDAIMKQLASPVANANWVKAILSNRLLHSAVSSAGSPTT